MQTFTCLCSFAVLPAFSVSAPAMAPRFNPRVPKRGRARQVLKRPASKKKGDWRQVPYVRDPAAPALPCADRHKWKRSLVDVVKCSVSSVVSMLRADRLLPAWEGALCPHCQRGTMGKLASYGGVPKHRCNFWKCKKRINPHHAHPLFVEGTGSGSTPLPTQAAMLMLLLNNVPHAAIHRLLQINHKAIEDMQKRLYQLRTSWVLKKEKDMCFGKSQQWADVEADEATFDRMIKGELVEWEQWCGIIQRGQPSTLVLHRLTPPLGQARAPGPGAVRKVEWKPLAKKWLQGRQVVLHTDSAKSYKLQVPDVLHDRVVHKKKRMKVGTKFCWIAPKYVELQRHKVPGSNKIIKCKSGTQIIDRCWKFLKSRLDINQHSRVGSQLLKLQLRSAQYEYWRRGQDLWIDTGVLVQWFMASTVQAAG